jgi:Transcriptional regulator of a riboflavin/FAD biosynthetic operon
MTKLEGRIVSGKGEAKEYLSDPAYQSKFEKLLGFSPFPGTLNMEVSKVRRKLFQNSTHMRRMESFSDNGTEYIGMDIYICQHGETEIGVLDLDVTDHEFHTVEMVSPVKLRDEFNLQDGDYFYVQNRNS